jgi:DNA modification methylase
VNTEQSTPKQKEHMTLQVARTIVQQRTDVLLPYTRNSRTHSDAQVAQIAASIREFGFTNPVLVDGDNGIVAGHGRVMAAKQLGLAEVPTISVGWLTEGQRRAYVIADNQLALTAGWDEAVLAQEVAWLQGENFNTDLLGFDADFLDGLLAEQDATSTGLADQDDAPAVQANAITQPSDVWVMGKHRLMCGDSTSVESVNTLTVGGGIDMVFTDPPYGVSIVNVKTPRKVGGDGVVKFGKVGGGGVVDAKDYAEIIGDDTTETARKFYETCVACGFENFIIWGGNYFSDFLKPSPCWIVWDKQNSGNFADVELAWCSESKAAKLYTFTWNGMSREGNRKDELKTRVHPTQKPVGLFENIFADFVFETCFDGFLGSGSTLIACEKTGRTCYGMEMSQQYCDVIVRRWQAFTGKRATLESTGQPFPESPATEEAATA